MRALSFAEEWHQAYRDHREVLKDTVVWNIEQGHQVTGAEIAAAEILRTEIYHRQLAFFDEWDFLVGPVSQVPPFPIEQRWIEEIEGVAMETYIDWMAVCCVVTLTGLPAISVPAGFSASGLPVGLQLVGRPRGDRALLELAHAFEQATGHARVRPVFD